MVPDKLVSTEEKTKADLSEVESSTPKQGAGEGLRYAEKDRTATCKFADLIARASIEECKQQCPGFLEKTLHSTEQTVLAAILMTKGSPPGPPKVLSFGMGTKFVRAQAKERDQELGNLVHDSHAEILARRAFIRVVVDELIKLRKNGESDFLCIDKETQRAQLQSDVCLHLYTSSTPCGNSSVRRWASAKPEPQMPADLPPNSWPSLPHEAITLANRGEGQIAASVKRDLESMQQEQQEQQEQHQQQEQQEQQNSSEENSKKSKKKGGKEKPTFAEGTAEPKTGQGNILSCSDKIALWNIVGLQSKWLVDNVEPLYLTTLTVGRKFARRHLQRAVCCRLQEMPAHGPFILHHPVLLRTSVKLNEGNVEQDAKAAFSNSVAVHWATGDTSGTHYLQGDEGIPVDGQVGESPLCRAALLKYIAAANLSQGGVDTSGLRSLYAKAKLQSVELLMSRDTPSFIPRKRRKQHQQHQQQRFQRKPKGEDTARQLE